MHNHESSLPPNVVFITITATTLLDKYVFCLKPLIFRGIHLHRSLPPSLSRNIDFHFLCLSLNPLCKNNPNRCSYQEPKKEPYGFKRYNICLITILHVSNPQTRRWKRPEWMHGRPDTWARWGEAQGIRSEEASFSHVLTMYIAVWSNNLAQIFIYVLRC